MSANASEDICPSFAAAAIIILEVRSTHVTIQVWPLLVAGRGPIRSIAQLVNGCSRIDEKDSVRIRN